MQMVNCSSFEIDGDELVNLELSESFKGFSLDNEQQHVLL